MEADQVLLACQQCANNHISANFPCKINRTFKLPKSLTTTIPTFDGKSEKFELFEDLFQNNQSTEDDRINYFHTFMMGDELQHLETLMA